MITSYHMIFSDCYSGSLNKYGGLPTHLPKKWPQLDGYDLTFLFQIYCDKEKLDLPDTLCLQGYQLIENQDYMSEIIIIQIPHGASRNYEGIGIRYCPYNGVN